MAILGRHGSAGANGNQAWQLGLLGARGSPRRRLGQHQPHVIAERILGLPAEPRTDYVVSWRELPPMTRQPPLRVYRQSGAVWPADDDPGWRWPGGSVPGRSPRIVRIAVGEASLMPSREERDSAGHRVFRTLLTTDPPEHHVHRTMAGIYFRPRTLHDLEARMPELRHRTPPWHPQA